MFFETEKHVICRSVPGDLYAFPIADVVQIVDAKEIEPVVDAPPEVVGTMIFRTRKLPLVTLDAFGETKAELSDYTAARVVVLQKGDRWVGVLTPEIWLDSLLSSDDPETQQPTKPGCTRLAWRNESGQHLDTVLVDVRTLLLLLEGADPVALETKGDIRQSILLVDDAELVRKVTRRQLEKFGFAVVEAGSGEEAEQILRDQGEFLLVVSDIEMPEKNGFDLVSFIRSQSPLDHMPVILHTAKNTSEYRDLADTCGADGFFLKNELGLMMEKIQSILKERNRGVSSGS